MFDIYRQGVKFHSGTLLTPELVKASIERSMKINERGKTNLKLESITTDGEYVIFKTKQPYGAFILSLSEPLFTIVDTTVDTTKFKEAPITTGPYKITAYDPKVSFEMEAFDEYWGGKPAAKSMTVNNIGDDNARSIALQSGDIDIAQRLGSGSIDLFKDNEDYILKSTTGTRTNFMFMNTSKAPLSDKNIRLAINSAVNYEVAAKTIGGGAVPVGAPFPPSTPYYKGLNVAKYDAEKAKKYLAEAGYKDTDGDGYVDKNGKNLELEISSPKRIGSILPELVQAQLGDIGIKTKIDIVENAADIGAEGKFDLLFTGWQTTTTGDPQFYLEQLFKTGSKKNDGRYSNKELDTLIEKLSVTFDIKERENITKKISQIIIDEAFGTYVISQANINVSNKKVKNMKVFPIDYYFLTADTEISK